MTVLTPDPDGAILARLTPAQGDALIKASFAAYAGEAWQPADPAQQALAEGLRRLGCLTPEGYLTRLGQCLAEAVSLSALHRDP